jgi:hypothetical protein
MKSLFLKDDGILPQTLFILGNGFDISHGLPTRYSDFKKFLKTKYELDDTTTLIVPQAYDVGHHGDTQYEDNEIAKFIYDVLNQFSADDWNDFEASLGRLKFDDFFHEGLYDKDKEGDINPWHTATNVKGFADQIFNAFKRIADLFEEWISSIDCSEAKQNLLLNSFFKKGTIFLSFNYTQTLEQLYNIPEVIHVHGTVDTEKIFGHGFQIVTNCDPYLTDTTPEGINEAVSNMLKKPVEKVLEQYADFFKIGLKDVRTIFSYGFSFSVSDMEYFRFWFKNTDSSKMEFYLDEFPGEVELHKIMTRLRDVGYKGLFMFVAFK